MAANRVKGVAPDEVRRAAVGADMWRALLRKGTAGTRVRARAEPDPCRAWSSRVGEVGSRGSGHHFHSAMRRSTSAASAVSLSVMAFALWVQSSRVTVFQWMLMSG